MNMKRTIALVLTIAICATMALGGTLAFLTDTEEALNVMTVGRVNIELIEQQRNENGDLEDYEQNKQLLPIVGSAQSDPKDGWGMPDQDEVKNYMDKIVNVNNIGNTPAYVRVIVGIPAALEQPQASENVLHWNYGNRFDPEGQGRYNGTGTETWNPDYLNVSYEIDPVGTATVDEIEYNVYVFTYEEPIAAKEGTKVPAIVGCYLDSRLDWDDDSGDYIMNGDVIDYDFTQGIKIPVVAQAVQADGFETAADAFEASGLPEIPWDSNDHFYGVVINDEKQFEDFVAVNGGDLYLDETLTLTSSETTIWHPTHLYLGEHAVISNRTGDTAAQSSTLTVANDAVIEGDGMIKNDVEYAITLKKNSDIEQPITLTIKGGHYQGVVSAINVVEGTLIIEGGYFEVGESTYGTTYLINCNDANYRNGTANVVIKGGTFVDWQPDKSYSENPVANFVAEGYKAVCDEVDGIGYWSVIPE